MVLAIENEVILWHKFIMHLAKHGAFFVVGTNLEP